MLRTLCSILLFVALGMATHSWADVAPAGVGSGGGGSGAEAQIIKRFWQVILRVEASKPDDETRSILTAIQTALTQPLKIEFVNELVYCDSGLPIKERKDAWGCPGRLQLLPSFNAYDDSLIFHELTRITPGFTEVDGGNMRISIGKLGLNAQLKRYFVMKQAFSKNRYTRREVQELTAYWASTDLCVATGYREEHDKYIFTCFADYVSGPYANVPDDALYIEK